MFMYLKVEVLDENLLSFRIIEFNESKSITNFTYHVIVI